MFSDIGNKIKGIMVFFFVLGAIVSGIVAVAIYNNLDATDDAAVVAIEVFVILLFACWLSCLFMYGFGQLVENTDIMKKQLTQHLKYISLISLHTEVMKGQNQPVMTAHKSAETKLSGLADKPAPRNTGASDVWVCQHCNTNNESGNFCISCGKHK